jgi:3-carboxy-cis,cis-muconate cycloisomerase
VAAAGEPRLAQALTEALTPSLGRDGAHEAAALAVREADLSGRPLADVLRDRVDVDVDAVLRDAVPDVGEAGAQVDAVLAAHGVAR